MKLYKIKTVLKYVVASWGNSAYVVKQCHRRCRLVVFFDLIYWFVKYGNDFNDYCTFTFWEKSSEERKSYISLRRNNMLRFAMSTSRVYDLFLDKAAFNRRFSDFVYRGWITTEEHTLDELLSFVKKYPSVIAKPLDDSCGHGVFAIGGGDQEAQEKLSAIKTENRRYILEEKIENVDYIKKIAPGSLNTLRFVTVIDKQGELHIIAALLRMGNGIAVTDNYHDGGVACPIDMETGKLRATAYGMKNVSCTIHPYSKTIFEGFPILHYSQCVEAIKMIAYVEPEARYVGWDIAITPNGIELLEGNIPAGEDITQIATGRGMWYDMLQWI